MKNIAQALAALSLVLSTLRLFNFNNFTHPALAAVIRPLKLLAGALTLFVTGMGAAGAFLGLLSKSPLAIANGLAGAALSSRFFSHLFKSQDSGTDGVAQTRIFGANWQGQQAAQARNPRHSPWQKPAVPRPGLDRDVVYHSFQDSGKAPRHLLCDIWRPASGIKPTGLAFIYLHGGGWSGLDKGAFTRPFFEGMTGQGHLVMDVAYRLYPETNMAGMLGDCRRAVAWLKANAEKYNIDPGRIVLGGGSAGGHLALLAAYTPEEKRLIPGDLAGLDNSVRAAVAFYPVVDLRAHLAQTHTPTTRFGPWELISRRDVLAYLLGGSIDEIPQQYDLYSPTNHVDPGCPPTLLLQGEHDGVVPPEPVRKMYQKLVQAGVPAVYAEFPGVEHGFDLALPQISPLAQAATQQVEQFLALFL